jgi:hypothetical protein
MSDALFSWPQGEELVYLRPPQEEYHGKMPCFPPIEAFPEMNPLQENWEAIRDEILDFEKRNGPIYGMSALSSPAETAGNVWSTINLMSYLMLYHKNRKNFPFLCSLTDKIPNIVTVTISVLAPNMVIKPHYGDTNGIIRAHLGLIVPAPYPELGIRVGDEERGWEDGKFICITVVNRHSVWSRSPKKRYILIVDFTPKIIEDKMVEICTKTLGSQTYIFLYHKLGFVKKLPESVAAFLCSFFAFLWRFYLPIQRRFKFL